MLAHNCTPVQYHSIFFQTTKCIHTITMCPKQARVDLSGGHGSGPAQGEQPGLHLPHINHWLRQVHVPEKKQKWPCRRGENLGT